MVVIDNVKKLFSYNWPVLVKSLFPNGNKKVIESEAQKNIRIGAIIRILSVVVLEVAVIGVAVYAIIKAYGAVFGNEIASYAVNTVLKENIGSYIVEMIKAAIIPIAILIYNEVMKNKEQNAWVYFVILLVSLFQTLVSLFGLFGWFGSLLVSPIFALIGIVSIGLNFLGNVSIAVGCIDFCEHEVSNVQPTSTVGGYQPNAATTYNQQSVEPQQPVQTEQVVPTQQTQPVQPVQQVNVEQNVYAEQPVVQPTAKFCTNCGNKVSSDADACYMCGNKL